MGAGSERESGAAPGEAAPWLAHYAPGVPAAVEAVIAEHPEVREELATTAGPAR